MIKYIVQSPIYGYSGMGYESTHILEKSFDKETDARKHLKRCNKAWQIYREVTAYPGRCYTDREEIFTREICDGVSFHFSGHSKLFKRETIDIDVTDVRISKI